EVDLTIVPGRDFGERLAATPVVDHFSFRYPGLFERHPAAPDHHRTIRLVPWKRSQQHGVHDAENCRVRAYTERQREDGDESKRGVPAERSGAIAQILHEGVEEGRSAHSVG